MDQERSPIRELIFKASAGALGLGLIGVASSVIVSAVCPKLVDFNVLCLPSSGLLITGTLGMLLNIKPSYNYKDLREHLAPGSDDTSLYNDGRWDNH